ncbi:hypothetical protein SDC9_133616 [bioreactor metagenome]|uniref:Uncharacterized protein n=1 Tax=bioreactor metagenome TaxID=1076179 RepID=A0A645DBF9_9ZZZZ
MVRRTERRASSKLPPGERLLQGGDAFGAEVRAPVELLQVFRGAAPDARRRGLLQDDLPAVRVHQDFKAVLFLNAEALPRLDRQDDPAQLIHLSDNAG